jgi:hypothetical protein
LELGHGSRTNPDLFFVRLAYQQVARQAMTKPAFRERLMAWKA